MSRAQAVRSLLLAAGLAVLVFLIARLGVGTILTALVDLRWSIPPAMLLFAGLQIARALALTLCAPAPRTLSFADALAIRLSGEAVQFLTFTGPILAEPAKAWLLRRRGFTTWEGLAATLAEYLACSLVAALMAIAGMGYLLAVLDVSGPIRAAAIVVLVAMLLFVVLFIVGIGARLHIIGAVVRAVARLPLVRDRLRGRIEGLPVTEDLLIATLGDHPARLARILAIETIGQACLALELFVLLRALHPAFGIGSATLLEGATKFITAGYFFVPGQVGVAEGTYAVLFTAFGLAAPAGVAVSFVRRIRSIVTASVGLAAMSRLTKTPVAPAG